MKSMMYKIIMMALALTAGSLVRAMDAKHSFATLTAKDVASGGFDRNFVGAMEQDRNLAALASTAVVDTLFNHGITSATTITGGNLDEDCDEDYVADGYRYQIKRSQGQVDITISSPSIFSRLTHQGACFLKALKHQSGCFFNGLYHTLANGARYTKDTVVSKCNSMRYYTRRLIYGAKAVDNVRYGNAYDLLRPSSSSATAASIMGRRA